MVSCVDDVQVGWRNSLTSHPGFHDLERKRRLMFVGQRVAKRRVVLFQDRSISDGVVKFSSDRHGLLLLQTQAGEIITKKSITRKLYNETFPSLKEKQGNNFHKVESLWPSFASDIVFLFYDLWSNFAALSINFKNAFAMNCGTYLKPSVTPLTDKPRPAQTFFSNSLSSVMVVFFLPVA